MKQQKIQIDKDTLITDGLIRTAEWEYIEPLYNKKVKFSIPNYAIPISISPLINNLEIRLRINHILTNSNFYVQKIFDIDNVIMPQVRKAHQATLEEGKYVNEVFRKFFYQNIMILDSCSESLYFSKNLNKFGSCKRISSFVSHVANELFYNYNKLNSKDYQLYRDKKLDEIWNSIFIDDKILYEIESHFHKQGIAVYGDIILPFTKMIKTQMTL